MIAQTKGRPMQRILARGVLALALVGCGKGDDGAKGAGPGKSGEGSGDRAVSVLTAPVAVRDVPIYLEGIGTVAPLKTVIVRSQVDGPLMRTAFEEGQRVRKGDLLAQIDPRPFTIRLHQAEAALARDRASLRSGRATLERYETVRKENLIAQQQLDDQRATVEQTEATIQSDQAAVEQARLQLDYTRIRSPIDGVTGVRLVDPGNIVRATDAGGIVMVTQLDPIAVLFTLPQDDLARVAAEMQKGALAVDVLSRDAGATLGSGQLALIDNQINQTTASIRLKAVLPNPTRALWPNAFVKARLLLTTRKGARVVPAAAVQRGPQGGKQETFAYVVGPDQKAVVRALKIDAIEGDIAVVTQGLEPGEEVVIEGQGQLRPGAKVAAKHGAGSGRQGGGAKRDGNNGAGGAAAPAPGSDAGAPPSAERVKERSR
jgi:membrane fusion protein, multidrug efflux system